MFSRSSSSLGWIGVQPSSLRVWALEEGWSVAKIGPSGPKVSSGTSAEYVVSDIRRWGSIDETRGMAKALAEYARERESAMTNAESEVVHAFDQAAAFGQVSYGARKAGRPGTPASTSGACAPCTRRCRSSVLIYPDFLVLFVRAVPAGVRQRHSSGRRSTSSPSPAGHPGRARVPPRRPRRRSCPSR